MNTRLPSFTPVRRRDYYTHSQKLDQDDTNNWTTSRCNRLLRPLISRIVVLQRINTKSKVDSKDEAKEVSTTLVSTEESTQVNTSESDDEWAPPRKRVKRTYSKRGNRKGLNGRQSWKSHGLRVQVPGEYVLPTPVLDYAAYYEIASNEQALGLDSDQQILLKHTCGRPSKEKRPNPRYMTLDGAAHFQLTEDLRAFKKSLHSDTYRAYEGIFNSLETILRTTTPTRSPPKAGAKSLLSMCLNRVPEYIAEEEFWEKKKTPEDRSTSAFEIENISNEIYTELENFGASVNGWKHLRAVVRSHGIFHIKEAVRKGLFDIKFSAVLVDLCIHMKGQDEAESILSVMLEANYPEPQSIQSIWPEGQPLSALTTLDKFSEYTGHRSYQYRQLIKLFSNTSLPSPWLATRRFGPLWTRAFQLASYESYDQEATQFLIKVIPMLCEFSEHPEEWKLVRTDANELSKASMATLTSVLATLTAIIILRRGTGGTNEDIPDRFQMVLQASGLQLRHVSSRPCPERALILTMANMVTQSEVSNVNKYFTTLLRSCSSTKTMHHLATFLVSVARCCRRASTRSIDSGYLEILHSTLRDRMSLLAQDVRSLVAEVLIDSASMMSKHDTKYSRYAKSLQTEFYDVGTKEFGLEVEDDGESCFRWEEGISEWVTATPALPMKAKQLQSFEDSDDDTPVRPRVVRPKKESLLKRIHMTPSRPPPRRGPIFSMERDHLCLSSPVNHGSSLLSKKQDGTTMMKVASDKASGSIESLEASTSAASSPIPVVEKGWTGSLSMIVDDSDDELNSSGLTFDDSEDDMDTLGVDVGTKRPFTLCTKVERRRSGRVAGSEDELGF